MIKRLAAEYVRRHPPAVSFTKYHHFYFSSVLLYSRNGTETLSVAPKALPRNPPAGLQLLETREAEIRVQMPSSRLDDPRLPPEMGA